MNIWDSRANEIFIEAMERPEADRAAYLKEASNGDAGLERRVESLLVAAENSKDLIERPAFPRPVACAGDPRMESGLLAGKYRLEEKIGSGGMGVVYAAMQTTPIVRKVAIKLIRNDGGNTALLARFEQERQALALMDHSNIAKVLDAGASATGQPFFVMEHITGVSLIEFCDRANLMIAKRLELFVDVCRGLHHAHQKGVIHRDLKPSNVLVSEVDGVATAKLIDFGVAKAVGSRLIDRTIQTAQWALVGTLEYMAPEQTRLGGGDVDIRSDVYSMGVILYELLTGLRPLDAERLKSVSLDEAIRIVREEDPPSLVRRLTDHSESASAARRRRTDVKSLLTVLRGDLSWIVFRCLAKDRERRYASANDLANDILRYLANEPIEARPPTSAYRLRKFVQRRRGVAVAASLVMLSLIATTIGFARAENARMAEAAERADAETARDQAWDALDAMTSAVTGPSLAAQLEVSPEQKTFLRGALESYRALASAKANDERSRKRTAHAAARVGHIEYILGDHKRSFESYRAAADGFVALATSFPREREYRRLVAACYGYMGAASRGIGRASDEEVWLGKAATTIGELVLEDVGNATYRSESALATRNLSAFLLRVGRLEEAVANLKKAQSLLETLILEQPDSELHRTSLAACHNAIGHASWSKQDRPEAERHFRKAIELREALEPQRKATPAIQHSQSADHSNLGAVLCEMNRLNEGVVQLRRGVELLQRLADRFPSRPDYRQRLATTMMNLANFFGAKGEKDEETKMQNSAIEMLERLVAEHPSSPEYQVEAAGAYCNVGIRLGEQSRCVESIASFDKAILRLERAKDSGGASVKVGRFLLNSYRGRARINQRALHWSAAVDDYSKAIPLASNEEAPRLALSRAFSLVQAKRNAEAIVELDRLPSDRQWDALEVFTRACIEASLAETLPENRAEYADRAMRTLETSLRGGLSNPSAQLQNESLAPLRSRTDFQKLLREFSESTVGKQ